MPTTLESVVTKYLRSGSPAQRTGHVDDYTGAGGEYHMRPQFFANRGGGRFVELFGETLGEYFAGRSYYRDDARQRSRV